MQDADPRIAKILEVMGQRAQFHKHKVNVVIARQRKEQQSMTCKLAMSVKIHHHYQETEGLLQEHMRVPAITAPPLPQHGSGEEAQTPSTVQAVPEDIIPSDAEWLDSFSRLLAAELDAPPGELFPPLFD